MGAHDKKTVLFWGLVLGIFFIVFLFWIPSFIQSISTITSAMSTASDKTGTEMRDTVTPQIDELKKKFDALLKALPANTATTVPVPDASPH